MGPTYDTNGNLTGGDGTGNSYIYHSLNHLVSANTGGITFALRYDALGRPYSLSGSNGLVRQWAWAGSRLVRETRNGAATNILPGQGTERLAVGTSFAVNNERGSVVALAHGVSGSVTGVVYRCDTFWRNALTTDMRVSEGLLFGSDKLQTPGLDPSGTDFVPHDLYGYAHVSTHEQDLAIQIATLKAAGCQVIRTEKKSGSSRQGRTEMRAHSLR